MSDAVFESQDSEAAWTALGNRMRRNRSWLLLMFVALGLYMAAQSWARVRRDGMTLAGLTSNVALTSSTSPTALPPSPISASPPGKSAAASPEAVAQPHPKQAGHTARGSDNPNAARQGPKQPSANRAQAGGRDAPKGPAPPHAGSKKPTRTDPRQQPGEIEAFGESAGEWVAQWQRHSEDSRAEGTRLAARALAKYARLPARVVRVQPEIPSVPPKVGPAETHAPHATPPTTTEHMASDGPQLPSPAYAGLSIRNPSRTGGTVHYLVNGQDHALRPGESQELPTGQWLIEFHRGGDGGDTAYKLAGGSYRFEITANGWELLSGE